MFLSNTTWVKYITNSKMRHIFWCYNPINYISNLKVSLDIDAHTVNMLIYLTTDLIWVCSYYSGLYMPTMQSQFWTNKDTYIIYDQTGPNFFTSFMQSSPCTIQNKISSVWKTVQISCLKLYSFAHPAMENPH